MNKGSCLCGGVQYEVSELAKAPTHCHCSMCQKVSGAAFCSFGVATDGAFTYTKGQELVRDYASSDEYQRSFCSVCGSTLTFGPKAGGRVAFALGTLDESAGIEPDRHIFIEDAVDWFKANDGLPKTEGYG